MKILVTGVSGFLGWNLAQEIQWSTDWELLGTIQSNPAPPNVKAVSIDLADIDSIRQVLTSAVPDVVIHTAALSKMSQCEKNPDLAKQVNVKAVEEIVNNLKRDSHFIYCSTDLVFDGLAAPYKPSDPPTPCHTYGRTKAEGEIVTQRHSGPMTIARLSLMYGHGPAANPSFIGWLDQGLRNGRGAPMFSDEFRTAIYVRDAVDGLLEIVRRKATGIFHLAGPERMARDEFARVYARVFELDDKNVRSMKQQDANLEIYRPPDVSLDISRAREALDFSPMAALQGLTDMKERLSQPDK